MERPCGEAEMGRRTTARVLTTAEEGRGRRGHDKQVRSDRDKGECHRAGKGDSDTESEG